MRISQKQILEWSENPVTIRLKEEAEKELEKIDQVSVTDCLFFGNPQRTHENLVGKQAREGVWGTVVELLEGDWTYFEEDEDE